MLIVFLISADVTVEEIVQEKQFALSGCPVSAQTKPSGTAKQLPTQTSGREWNPRCWIREAIVLPQFNDWGFNVTFQTPCVETYHVC